MPAFSFSPPVFTEQDERREREKLSREQEEELWADIKGEQPWEEAIRVLRNETAEIRERGLLQLHEAMESIAMADKLEYLEALERCPDLVETESPPVLFLQCERYDAWAAASRLAMYWKTRKLAFGEDRAFLPMTLLPGGAMFVDIDNYRRGRSFVLTEPDRAGRPVILVDRDACAKIGRDSAIRCSFYLGQVVSEYPEAPCRGHVAIVDCQHYDLYRHEDRVYTKRSAMISASIPARAVSVHLYAGYSKTILSLVFPAIKFIFSHLRLRVFMHSGSSRDIQRAMAEFGLHPDHASMLLTGVIERNHRVEEFIRERQQIEQNRSKRLIVLTAN